MSEILIWLAPNLKNKIPELYLSIEQTIYMLFISGAIAIAIGLVLGVILIVTSENGILRHRTVHQVLEMIVNIFRSIPFVILLAALIPVSRFIVGTSIGTVGAIVPLVVGTVPFFARQVESALSTVDKGLIEAAQSMGSSPIGIILRVYLKESIPNLIRVIQITAISLIGLTAMAGAIGGGGLGDFAIRYGHQRGQNDVTYITVAVILVMVAIIQSVGNIFIKRTNHK